MSEQSNDINFSAAAPAFQRKGKRRNCFFVPGSSDPLVAQKFCDSVQKECFGFDKTNQGSAQMDIQNPQLNI